MTTVIDASVTVAALVDSGKSGRWAEGVIATDTLLAPELVLVEATNVLRRLERAKDISRLEANAAQRDLMRLGARFLPFAPLAERVWELRHGMTSYDATYVALAEAFDARLATLDRKLARNAQARCEFLTPPR